MEKSNNNEIKIEIRQDSELFENDYFIMCYFKHETDNKWFYIKEQSNISNINSEHEYLCMVKMLDENFLNLKQYKLEFSPYFFFNFR